MELTVVERLILLNILPAETSLAALGILHRLRMELSFSEEEHEILSLKFGMDWSGGCPRCGSEDLEYLGEQQRLGPERKCTGCGFEGMHGRGQAFWDEEVKQTRDMDIGREARKIVTAQLEELAGQNKLRQEYWSLCQKFGLVEEAD